MKKICPNPLPWHNVFQRLVKYSELHPCAPLHPPKPLILAGWQYSNDAEKMQRWHETVDWATINGCTEILCQIPDSNFYFAAQPTNDEVIPQRYYIYHAQHSPFNDRPTSEQIAHMTSILSSQWTEIVGSELARITYPLSFTGKKARRLLVAASASDKPPWGTWTHLSWIEPKRRAFTYFRAAINRTTAPHEVDHIDFKIIKYSELIIISRFNFLQITNPNLSLISK